MNILHKQWFYFSTKDHTFFLSISRSEWRFNNNKYPFSISEEESIQSWSQTMFIGPCHVTAALSLSADSRNPPAIALVSAALGASFLFDDFLNAAQHASLQSSEVLRVAGCVCASIVRYTLSETKLKDGFYLPLEPFSKASGEIKSVCPGLGVTRKPICSLRPVSFMFFCL